MSFIDVFKEYNPFKPKYFAEVYAKHLNGKENLFTTVMEIGVQTGRSTDMWATFFPQAQVHGIDNCPEETYTPTNPRIHIHFGDQADIDFLAKVIKETGDLDFIVDDGGHHTHEQVGSFDFLWPHVKPGGLYVIEDIFTSYRGGHFYLEDDTTLKHLFELVGTISEGFPNRWYSPGEEPNKHRISCIHFYDTIVVIEKDAR